MRRLTAVFTGLLGLLATPLALSATTAWLGALVHLAVTLLCAGLAAWDGLAGRPFAARAWGGWSVVVTGGVLGALHLGAWTRGEWLWAVPFVLVLAWGWIAPAAAVVAGALGDRTQRVRARRAVAARRRQLASNSVG